MSAAKPLGVPELRALIDVARAYVAGEVHFSYVCIAVVRLEEAMRYMPVSGRIREMADEWGIMAVRVWPEWARIDNPISEAEFRAWVQAQLAVFESE